jgi:hypothetical protein
VPIHAALGEPESGARWAFYGGSYERVGAPEPQRIDGTGSAVTETNWSSFSTSGRTP